MSSPSAANQPDNISAYVKWLAEERGVEISLRNETHYRSLVPRAQRDMRESELWKTLLRRLPEFNDEYYVSTGYQLLAAPMFELQSKSYESFLLKTFRKNILENSNWPEPPMRGWFLPD